jgi:hypothetical protein
MSEPLWQPRTDYAARLLGAGFFIGGGSLLGFQLKVILDAAAAQAERVTYFMAAIGLGEMGLLLGGYWLVRGLAGYTAVRNLQSDPRRMRTFASVVTVVIGASLLGMKYWLASLGYDD